MYLIKQLQCNYQFCHSKSNIFSNFLIDFSAKLPVARHVQKFVASLSDLHRLLQIHHLTHRHCGGRFPPPLSPNRVPSLLPSLRWPYQIPLTSLMPENLPPSWTSWGARWRSCCCRWSWSRLSKCRCSRQLCWQRGVSGVLIKVAFTPTSATRHDATQSLPTSSTVDLLVSDCHSRYLTYSGELATARETQTTSWVLLACRGAANGSE